MLSARPLAAIFTFVSGWLRAEVGLCALCPLAPSITPMLGSALRTAVFTCVFWGLRAGREPLHGVAIESKHGYPPGPKPKLPLPVHLRPGASALGVSPCTTWPSALLVSATSALGSVLHTVSFTYVF